MAQSTRKFHRYVYSYEILSEEPIGDASLSEIQELCDSGPCSGRFLNREHEELGAKATVRLLEDQGSDPSFFQLTAKGEEVDE